MSKARVRETSGTLGSSSNCIQKCKDAAEGAAKWESLDKAEIYQTLKEMVGQLTSGSMTERVRAVRLLASASAQRADLQSIVISAGALPTLVWSMGSKSSLVQGLAAGSLGNLAMNARLHVHIESAGAFPRLIEMLAASSVDLQVMAAKTLRNLCSDQNTGANLVFAGAIPALVRCMASPAEDVIQACTEALVSLTLSKELRRQVKNSGVVPFLVLHVQPSYSVAVRRTSVSAMNAIWEGHDMNGEGDEAGAIPALVPLLKESGLEAFAACALGILSLDTSNKDEIIKAGALPSLLCMLRSRCEHVHGTAVWVLSRLALDPRSLAQVSLAGAYPDIVTLMGSGLSDVAERAVTAALLMTSYPQGQLGFVEAGAVDVLVRLIRGGETCSIRAHAMGVLRNIASADDSQLQAAASSCLPAIIAVLREVVPPWRDSDTDNSVEPEHVDRPVLDPSMVEHAAGALRNFFLHEGNRHAALKQGIVPLLLDLLEYVLGEPDLLSWLQANCQTAGALRNLMLAVECCFELSEGGAVRYFVDQLSSGCDLLIEQAAGGLQNITAVLDDFTIGEMERYGALQNMVPAMTEEDTPVEVMVPLTGAMRNLAQDEEMRAEMVKADAIFALVGATGSGSSKVREHAAGTLWSLAFHSTEDAEQIVSEGGIPALMALLKSRSPGVREQAEGALTALNVPLPTGDPAVK